MDQTFINWLLVLGIGFPLLSIFLGELAEILERQKHPLANAVRKVRQYLLPPLAVLLVMRELLKIARTEDSVRIVESMTWLAVILAGISLINAILITQKPEKKFQVQVPNLLFQISRTVVVLGIGYYLITGTWSINISGLTTALGIGSLVVALALQNTLSNLVSGLLLLIAHPFKIGDWIEANGVEARVVDLNWWSVTLYHKTRGYKIVIPNGSLAGATITNYGIEPVWKKVEVGFSYDDPPNQVIPAMNSLVDGIEGIEGPGYAGISSYGDSGINYELWYQILADGEAGKAYYKLMSRIYYMAKREGFTIPYPIQMEFNLGEDRKLPSKIPKIVENRQSEMLGYLRSLSYFFTANDAQSEQLAAKSQFKIYGAEELITQAGKPDEGLYAIYKGRVKSFLTDNLGNIQTDKKFGVGDVFGEMAIHPGEVSQISAIAEDDVEVVVIPGEEIVQLIQINPKFASEIIQFIEERKKAIRIVKGTKDSVTSMNGKGHQKVNL